VGKKSRKFLFVLAGTLLLMLSACSTISAAYDSTVDTVSGWVKSDDKK
jgi:starvation-inducible outer membrane lipoprotein